MKLTTTKTEFKSWLESKKPRQFVGFSKDSYDCPLAKYFNEINNFSRKQRTVVHGEHENTGEYCGVAVEETNKNGVETYERKAKLKPWMLAFVRGVDDKVQVNKRISPKIALEVLNSI